MSRARKLLGNDGLMDTVAGALTLLGVFLGGAAVGTAVAWWLS